MKASLHFGTGIATLVLLATAVQAPARERVELNGTWRFAIDPMKCGEQNGWSQPAFKVRDWPEVQVPHCWTVDPRFPYTGTAWYRRTFTVPAGAAQPRVRVVFGGVFYRAKVWLNGELIGEHEGGYTPFEFEVTPWIRRQGENVIAVQADNSWSTDTLPGARMGSRPHDQVYPWLEYGGIVRPVTLVLTGSVYVANQRVIATPALSNGTAAIDVTARIVNASGQPAKVHLGFTIARQGEKQAELAAQTSVPARSEVTVTARANLLADQVTLWDVDHPHLYTLQTRLWRDGDGSGNALDEPEPVAFGIRKVEARGARLLLNGEPIRMAGGNRHADHPVFGSVDPPELVDTDMRLMKRANMELSRISHYPASESLLDWADKHGALIIQEGLNWQLTEAQMDSAGMRSKFQSQMREMIERDWNHPSVIGWSVGNEYPSETPAGLRWTKDMVDFVRRIDGTRLLTFASDRAGSPKIATPEDEGSRYVDIVCINIYRDYEEKLDRIHARWPDKPVMVTEFAASGHVNLSDSDYEPYFRYLMSVFRSRPYVAGAAVWTFNDYRSRYPGTGPDGYRHYGAVTAGREPKPAYHLLAGEFAPAAICDVRAVWGSGSEGELSVSATIQARKDFPSYALRDYEVRCQVQAAGGEAMESRVEAMPCLKPGAQHSFHTTFKPVPRKSARVRVELLRPTGFVTAAQDFTLAP